MGTFAIRVVGADSKTSSGAYASSKVFKASPGRLFSVSGYNSGPAQFIQLHDAVSLPANGTAPVTTLAIGATQNFSFDFVDGIPFALGIVAANSTTGPTLTNGAADVWFLGTYR